jgi:hypothetical protein
MSVVENKLKKFDENELNNFMHFWDFYQAFNVCSALDVIQRNRRNELWKDALQGDRNAILTLRTLVYTDRTYVYQVISELKAQDTGREVSGDLWKHGRFAVAEYEYNAG